MAFDWKYVPTFGGGLNFAANPTALRDDEWTWGDGFLARNGYAEVAPSLTSLTPVGGVGELVIGMVQNPFTWDGGMVATVDATGPPPQMRVYSVPGTGAISANLAGAANGNQFAVLQDAFFNGKHMLCGGAVAGGGLSILSSPTGAIYATVAGFTALNFDYIAGFQDHLVVGSGYFTTGALRPLTQTDIRTAAWCDSNNELTWAPGIGNNADQVVLDDASFGITGMIPMSDNLILVPSNQNMYALIPTGGIPSFTRQMISRGLGLLQITAAGFPTTHKHQTFYGPIPHGIMFAGPDNLYAMLGGTPIPVGDKIRAYWAAPFALPGIDATVDYCRPLVWHEALGMVIVPIVTSTGATTALWWEPRSGAWSRATLVDTVANVRVRRLAYIYFYAGSSWRRGLWAASDQADGRTIYAESAAGVRINNVVDTKDITFGSPPAVTYLDRIKVDWEPRLNAATDALRISVYARNDLSPSILGAVGGNMDLSSQFVIQGTLTGGATELPVRVKGKYIRLRFTNTVGLCRIRGFGLRFAQASDVKGPDRT